MNNKSTTRPEQIRARRENNGNLTTGGVLHRFPEKPYPHGILFTFYNYDYQKFVSGIKTIAGETQSASGGLGLIPEFTISAQAEPKALVGVELPFPRTLRDMQGVRIDSFERDFLIERATSMIMGAGGGESLSGTLGNLAGLVENALGKVREIGGDPIGELTKALSGASNLESSKALAIGSYLARNIIAGDVARVVGAQSERVVNPQDTLSFNGVNLKEFTFEWDLFPSNVQDSQNIKNIVNFIKSRMLPTTEAVGTSAALSRAFLNYPSVVETQLLGVDASHFVQFKRGMIVNLEVDYAAASGGQVTIMQGGVPAAVKLSMTLRELAIHTAGEYDWEQQLKADAANSPPPDVRQA